MTSRRNQLLKKLIGTATGEDEKKLYQLTIERVCADMCEYYYKFYHNDGPGAMVYVPEHEDEKKSMFYLTVDNLRSAVDDLVHEKNNDDRWRYRTLWSKSWREIQDYIQNMEV